MVKLLYSHPEQSPSHSSQHLFAWMGGILPSGGQPSRIAKALFWVIFAALILILLLLALLRIDEILPGSSPKAAKKENNNNVYKYSTPTLTATVTRSVLINQVVTQTNTMAHYETIHVPAGDQDTAKALWQYTFDSFAKPVSGDLYGLTVKLRLFGELWRNSTVLGRIESVPVQELFLKAQESLFGWIRPRFSSLANLYAHSTRHARGIVMTTGPEYFHLVIHTIRSIRMLGCQLPVQVYYEDAELGDAHLKLLGQLPQVEAVRMSQHFDNSTLKIHGWDLKPFAMLASPYAETILMDADTVWLQPPDLLLTDPGYVETGVLLFPDRTLAFDGNRQQSSWLHRHFPEPLSQGILQSRFYRGLTHYEVESGVVVIDKRRAFLGLLAACQLNRPAERAVVHEKTHGEKETFWLGMEMAQQPYSLMPTPAGSIGRLGMAGGKHYICDKLLHFDRAGDLLWFNDGITVDKHKKDALPDPDYFRFYGREGSWTMLCLAGDLQPIPPKHKETILKIINLFVSDPLGNPERILATTTPTTATPIVKK